VFNLLAIARDKIHHLIGKYQYIHSSKRNSYRCKLVGEKPSPEENNTIIIYRILGKRDIFEISIRKLLENPELLSQFHPTEAVKFGAISMGDVLFDLDETKRKDKFNEIKQKMVNGTRG
jgi:hypothetical protein